MASDLLARSMLAALAGVTFGGARDMYQVLGYKKVLTFRDLYAKYERQDIVKRIIDEPIKALWGQPPIISLVSQKEAANIQKKKETEENQEKASEETAFAQILSLMVSKFDLWAALSRIDKLNAFGKYAGLVIGAPGDSAKALREISYKDIVYLQPYGSDELKVTQWEEDPSSPRFGLPKVYQLSRETFIGDGISNISTVGISFHYSRVIHFTNELLVSNSISSPRLAHIYNLLDDLLKVSGGSSETYWLNANRGMQLDVDKEMELSEKDAMALSDEMEEFQHQLRRYVRTRGVNIKNLGSDVADPSEAFKVIIGLLAGATGIPQRILLGAEAGQLASEQDRANWAVQVQQRRSEFAQPYMLRPLVMHLSSIGVLPAINFETHVLTYEWPEAFHLSPLERSQTMAQSARAVVNMSRQAQMGHPLITTEEARDILGLPEQAAYPLPTPLEAMEYLDRRNNPDLEEDGEEDGEDDDKTQGSPQPRSRGRNRRRVDETDDDNSDNPGRSPSKDPSE